MIATVDVADIGRSSLLRSLRHRPRPGDVAGLQWLDVAVAVPLATTKPPSFRRAALYALWDDENAARAFVDSHPLAKRFAGGFHAELEPLRAFGSWPGLPPGVSRSRHTQHDGPVIVMTLGHVRASQLPRFLRASRAAERAAINAEGFLWGTASARPPFVATVSVWRSDEAAAAYAYADPGAGHPQAIAEQRQKDFHRESAFIRFAVTSTSGVLLGAPAIDFSAHSPS
jgi:heme-degrading monooxygenase HmoA